MATEFVVGRIVNISGAPMFPTKPYEVGPKCSHCARIIPYVNGHRSFKTDNNNGIVCMSCYDKLTTVTEEETRSLDRNGPAQMDCSDKKE